MKAPAPALVDELAEEILLRFPADDPACLVRAALACKRSRRLVADPGFRRRFREFRGAPPVLGVFRNTSSGCIISGGRYGFARDRVIFNIPLNAELERLVVDGREPRRWRTRGDSEGGRGVLGATTEGHPLSLPRRRRGPASKPRPTSRTVRRAIFAALHTHPGPFPFISLSYGFMKAVDADHAVLARRTSSTRWPAPRTRACPSICRRGAAARLSAMGTAGAPPSGMAGARRRRPAVPSRGAEHERGTREKDGEEDLEEEEGHYGWAQRGVIDLKKLLPDSAFSSPLPDVVGFADGIGVIFLQTNDGVVTIDLKSSRVMRVPKISGGSSIFPYMSFYSPALGAPAASTGGDETGTSASSVSKA
ncbi:unnamed protein product [Urochloa decumbens]|uniref:F-box domain-containing protein n=1 Tax=Urochloa decumbens TaxID=240449 RepID=A0ABC9DAB6_9POAL